MWFEPGPALVNCTCRKTGTLACQISEPVPLNAIWGPRRELFTTFQKTFEHAEVEPFFFVRSVTPFTRRTGSTSKDTVQGALGKDNQIPTSSQFSPRGKILQDVSYSSLPRVLVVRC